MDPEMRRTLQEKAANLIPRLKIDQRLTDVSAGQSKPIRHELLFLKGEGRSSSLCIGYPLPLTQYPIGVFDAAPDAMAISESTVACVDGL